MNLRSRPSEKKKRINRSLLRNKTKSFNSLSNLKLKPLYKTKNNQVHLAVSLITNLNPLYLMVTVVILQVQEIAGKGKLVGVDTLHLLLTVEILIKKCLRNHFKKIRFQMKEKGNIIHLQLNRQKCQRRNLKDIRRNVYTLMIQCVGLIIEI